ncbi:polysaccharide deacetylase family protein [Clostridium cylindrosporum]|uniref:Putative xylanase/chitin deacetylase n=1 Tax=Clostridium cylindrosporum DSM 605 TaxID=1121307 RepID=A0A0J8DFW8_CLOCY|nr:polysaccharide deacetylase family protein [Clostridium cylindrosporum]KMT23129.1 putative xylanase/chitin deacetylase [Clostridium cylindrosporum DSM 605]
MRCLLSKKIIASLCVSLLLLISFISIIPKNSYAYSQNTNEKIIYLTFDDGPSKKVTEDVLDILQAYKVKATFFVVGEQFKGNESVLKRIHNEGHSLGLHSYTHNFSKLYNGNIVNQEFFIGEMLECQKELKEITGVESTILRFPGGSHKRLSDSLLDELNKHNLKVYDWTHSSEDAVNLKSPPCKLFKNSLKKIPSCKKAPGAILLMHCNGSNKNSVKALPLIIEHYQKEGYKFLTITPNTPVYHCE